MIRWAPSEIGAPDLPGASVLGRLRGSPPRGAMLIALWIAVVVAELLALRPVLFDREAPIQGLAVVFTLIGGSFAACGLVAWRRRPDSHSGMLMTATGFLFAAVRWWRASGPRRRALLPSLAGAFGLLCFAALLVNDLVSGTRSQPLLWIASCSLVTVPLAFLAGLLRSRLARAGLSDLFRDLRSTRGDALQATLAQALGDPSLVVTEGEPPAHNGDRSVSPVERDGRRFATLVYDSSLDDDPELVEAVTAAAAIALENSQLHAESEVRLAELQASRERIVAAGDAERRRLERNLHDGAQQRLVALAMQLRLIQADIRRDPAAAEALVTSASGELAQSLEELRELARGIHPAVLDHGLCPALESLAMRAPVPTAVTCDVGPLPQPVELAAYFVACEALANVAKYAGATAVSVRVSRTARGIVIEIADDGAGGAQPSPGSGL